MLIFVRVNNANIHICLYNVAVFGYHAHVTVYDRLQCVDGIQVNSAHGKFGYANSAQNDGEVGPVKWIKLVTSTHCKFGQVNPAHDNG